MLDLKKLAGGIALFIIGTTSFAQNMVADGDFENFTPAKQTQLSNWCYWIPVANPTPTSIPQHNYSNSVDDLTNWTTYRAGGTQGLDLYLDARNHKTGTYNYNFTNHTSCNGAGYFKAYETPGMSGTGQQSGPAMLQDGNLVTNNTSGYPHMEAHTSQPQTMASSNTRNDFMEGRFIQSLELFKKYKLTFKYSVPCDEDASDSGDNKIIFNLFDNELKNRLGNNYAQSYLHKSHTSGPLMNIDGNSFHWDSDNNGNISPGNHRLKVLEYSIPAGTQPCQWQTVTTEFCIADLMNDPNNNYLSTNPLYTSWNNHATSIGYLNNAHMFDVDYHASFGSTWIYSQNTYLDYFIKEVLAEGTMQALYDFKKIFGFTVRGNQDVYIDDVRVDSVGCNLNANFTVEQTCSTDENGNRFVKFSLTPNGPTSNPYMFFIRNVTNGGSFTQIASTGIILGGVHTITVPYVQGETFEFKAGTWAPAGSGCGWKQTVQTHTVDPNGNWFPAAPTFKLWGLQNGFLPSSYFSIVADPLTTAHSSKWDYQIVYSNGTVSSWLPVSTLANPTGNGNNQFVIWFDCLDAFHVIVNPDPVHSNVGYVKVRRTTYGSCDQVGRVEIRNYTNCQIEGKKQRRNRSEISKEKLDQLKKQLKLDENTVPASMETEGLGTMEVFPNPGKDIFNVQFETEGERTIYLTDLKGHVVREQFQTNQMKLEMDLSELNSGIYLLFVKEAGGTSTKKIVKQ